MESKGEDEGESGRRDGEGRAEREAERVEGRGRGDRERERLRKRVSEREREICFCTSQSCLTKQEMPWLTAGIAAGSSRIHFLSDYSTLHGRESERLQRLRC